MQLGANKVLQSTCLNNANVRFGKKAFYLSTLLTYRSCRLCFLRPNLLAAKKLFRVLLLNSSNCTRKHYYTECRFAPGSAVVARLIEHERKSEIGGSTTGLNALRRRWTKNDWLRYVDVKTSDVRRQKPGEIQRRQQSHGCPTRAANTQAFNL